MATTRNWRDVTFPHPRYSAGYADLTPAATPTDVFSLRGSGYVKNIVLRRLTISGTADSAATTDVLLQRSPTGGGGTTASMSTGKFDERDAPAVGLGVVYTANRTSNGDGISSSRPVIGQAKLTFATATTPCTPAVFDFPDGKGPCIRDLTQEYIVANLRGATMPTGAKLSFAVEWEEQGLPRIAMVGDSTTSNATGTTSLFGELSRVGRLNAVATIDNNGSNGMRLTDYINNTSSPTYSQASVLNRQPHVMVLCYGINDVRTGACSQSALEALIDEALDDTLASLPDCKIILWGPNSFTSDDPGATGFVTTTGLFSGMTLAAAAQAATDILYNAYEAFKNDNRIFALVQKQDIFGRTCQTVAASGLMTDILHPNARGQVLSARQIKPYIDRALTAVREIMF